MAINLRSSASDVEVKDEAVENRKANLTEHYESGSENVSEGEGCSVVQLKHETVEGSLAEALTRNRHVCISGLVNVLHDVLKALEEALSHAGNDFDESIVATGLLGLLADVVDEQSDREDQGNDE